MNDPSEATNVEPNVEPRGRPTFQFSIRSLLLFTLFIALALTSLLMYRRQAEAERELVKLRQEAGYLTIEDETQFHAVALPCEEPLTWKWRAYLPKGSKYSWNLGYGDAVPRSTVSGNGFSFVSTSEQRPRDEGIQALVTVSIRKDPLDADNRWLFTLSCRNAEQKSNSRVVTTIPDQMMQKILKSHFTERFNFGESAQEARKPGETIELLKWRLGEEITPNAWTISDKPQPGLAVWLDEVK